MMTDLPWNYTRTSASPKAGLYFPSAEGAAPPTLATQLNNGDILGAPARRSSAPAAPLRLSRSPPPPPHAPGGEGTGPEASPPPSAGRRHRELSAPGTLPSRGLRGGKRRERKGRGRVPPPPRSASGGAPRARAAAARSRRAREGSGLGRAAGSATQTTAGRRLALPGHVIQR